MNKGLNTVGPKLSKEARPAVHSGVLKPTHIMNIGRHGIDRRRTNVEQMFVLK